MSNIKAFLSWVGTPFRALCRALMYIVNLDRQQVRSLFSVAMLCGIVSLSAENWVLVSAAHHSIESGELNQTWFGLLVERTRYNSGLQAWFAAIMGLIVFGADYFRAKHGDAEVSFGKGGNE